MNPIPNFARMTRLCQRCKTHQPIAGSYQVRRGGRRVFVCAKCAKPPVRSAA